MRSDVGPRIPSWPELAMTTAHMSSGYLLSFFFFFSSRRRHTRCSRDLEFRRVLFRSAALELRNLEDVLEALQALDHVALTSAASSSTRPPRASIFWRADALMACTLTVRAWGTSPSPRIFTRSRSEFLMSRALTRPSASTTELAPNAASDLRLTIAYGCLPP